MSNISKKKMLGGKKKSFKRKISINKKRNLKNKYNHKGGMNQFPPTEAPPIEAPVPMVMERSSETAAQVPSPETAAQVSSPVTAAQVPSPVTAAQVPSPVTAAQVPSPAPMLSPEPAPAPMLSPELNDPMLSPESNNIYWANKKIAEENAQAFFQYLKSNADPPVSTMVGLPDLSYFNANFDIFKSNMEKSGYPDLDLVVDYCFVILGIPFTAETDPETAKYDVTTLSKYGRKKWIDWRLSAQKLERKFGINSVEYLTESIKAMNIQAAVNIIGLVKGWEPVPLIGAGGSSGLSGGKRSKKILQKRK